jgi:predicted metal-binding transcription factor (methanogenesis marker protein 9)
MGLVEYQIYENTVDVSNTRLKNLQIVQEEYLELRKKLDDIIVRTRKLEEQLDTKGIPYTKGKDESWKED